MNLVDSVNQFYFEMTASELRLLNRRRMKQSVSYHSMMYLTIISYLQNCTVTMLADRLQISKSAVTMKVSELVAQGLVVKTQSKEDKRVYYLRSSDEIEQMDLVYDQALLKTSENLKKEFSAEKIESFCEILDFLSRSFLADS